MIPILAIASLLSAALLFAVQPMAAKMALPLLGGSAGVWTTCMLFFQAGLLAGYAWAHFLGCRFSLRKQVLLHAALAGAALLTLPPAIGATGLPPVDASPAPWLLAALAVSFGLPYAVLAATGPLLQRWFASTDDARAADPYFLYATSNAGSFLGLLAYPLVFERILPLHALGGGASQAGVWSAGFGALLVLVIVSGIWASRRPGPVAVTAEGTPTATPWSSRLRWMAFAFVPSSTVLGVTQYLTSDIAAIPLFWILPLGIYLLTFVVAFSSRASRAAPYKRIAFGVALIAAAVEFHWSSYAGGVVSFAVHLSALAAVGLSCHGSLAAARPDRSHLTEYYLWIALGGCLGGVFNAILAPVIFRSIAEYPMALSLAAFLIPDPERRDATRGERIVAVSMDLAIAAAILAVGIVGQRLTPTSAVSARWLGAMTTGVPALLTLAVIGWPRRFACAVAALLAVTWTLDHSPWSAIYKDRTFYGVHRVAEVVGRPLKTVDDQGRSVTVAQKMHVLIDGVTRHGSQSLDPGRRKIPTTYYHPSGPLGDIVRGLRERGPIAEAALIGLGAGTVAAYAQPGERFTYFEIDPAVARIAQDPSLFTYVTDSRQQVDIVLGDGRRRIAECADGRFDLIVLDAFSSDSIPVHLLTREAVAIYLRKLKPRGCLAMHLTNGYIALEPVVAAIAASLGAPAAVKHDVVGTPQQAFEGKDLSKWAVMVPTDAETLPVRAADGWSRTRTDPSDSPNPFLWTDDRSDVVRLLIRGPSR